MRQCSSAFLISPSSVSPHAALSTIFVSRTVLLRISLYGSQSISMTTITRSDDTLIVSNIVTKVVTVIIIDLWCKMNNIHVIIASTLTVK